MMADVISMPIYPTAEQTNISHIIKQADLSTIWYELLSLDNAIQDNLWDVCPLNIKLPFTYPTTLHPILLTKISRASIDHTALNRRLDCNVNNTYFSDLDLCLCCYKHKYLQYHILTLDD